LFVSGCQITLEHLIETKMRLAVLMLLTVSATALTLEQQRPADYLETRPVPGFNSDLIDVKGQESESDLEDFIQDHMKGCDRDDKKDASTALCLWLFTCGAFTDFYLGFVARGFAKIMFGLTPLVLWLIKWAFSYGCCSHRDQSCIEVVKELPSVCWFLGFFNVLVVAWNMYDFSEVPFGGSTDVHGCHLRSM